MMLALLFLLGLVFGSFYNVLIWRIPRRESIAFPPSHCPNCRTRLQPYELVPVWSYVWQRGQCRHCHGPISIEYPIIELVTGVGFVITGWTAGSLGQLVAGLVLFSLLLVCGTIDLHHKIIPNMITIPGMVMGIVFSALGVTMSFHRSLGGLLLGGGVLLVIALLSRGGMGMGDVKLLACIGSFLGPLGVLGALFAASLLGSLVGIVYLHVTKQGRKTPIPFGPFLAMGAMAAQWFLDKFVLVAGVL